jgi:hypothetical protein
MRSIFSTANFSKLICCRMHLGRIVTENVTSFCLELDFLVSFHSTHCDQHVRERQKAQYGGGMKQNCEVHEDSITPRHTRRRVGWRGLWRASGDEMVTALTN